MSKFKIVGALLCIGAAGGFLLNSKLSKVRNIYRPKSNRVIEVELSEGVEPEDITIILPKRTRKS